jgi:hypothetical protein
MDDVPTPEPPSSNKILKFNTLTEASLKVSDYAAERAALTFRITADTPQPVLQYAVRRVIDFLDNVTGDLFEVYGLQEAKKEITKSASRLIELCEAIPNAPYDAGARERLSKWRLEKFLAVVDDPNDF